MPLPIHWLFALVQTAIEPTGLTPYQAVMAFFTAGNTAGLLLLAFKAGGYTRQIEVNTAAIREINEKGSPVVRELGAKLDAIATNMSELTEVVMRGACKYAARSGTYEH